jgi:hypothetical protein
MTSRCCWLIQPAGATSRNRRGCESGTMGAGYQRHESPRPFEAKSPPHARTRRDVQRRWLRFELLDTTPSGTGLRPRRRISPEHAVSRGAETLTPTSWQTFLRPLGCDCQRRFLHDGGVDVPRPGDLLHRVHVGFVLVSGADPRFYAPPGRAVSAAGGIRLGEVGRRRLDGMHICAYILG